MTFVTLVPGMARGPSGKIVLEVPQELKRRLHSRLALEGKTLKQWFVEEAERFLSRRQPEQMPLPESNDRSRNAR